MWYTYGLFTKNEDIIRLWGGSDYNYSPLVICNMQITKNKLSSTFRIRIIINKGTAKTKDDVTAVV